MAARSLWVEWHEFDSYCGGWNMSSLIPAALACRIGWYTYFTASTVECRALLVTLAQWNRTRCLARKSHVYILPPLISAAPVACSSVAVLGTSQCNEQHLAVLQLPSAISGLKANIPHMHAVVSVHLSRSLHLGGLFLAAPVSRCPYLPARRGAWPCNVVSWITPRSALAETEHFTLFSSCAHPPSPHLSLTAPW